MTMKLGKDCKDKRPQTWCYQESGLKGRKLQDRHSDIMYGPVSKSFVSVGMS